MTYSLTWLPNVLRAAGLSVVEEPGWKTRGHGDVGKITGVLCHHTAGAKSGDHPSLSTILEGRPDLRPPLAQLFLSRSGVFYVVAAGSANHAGVGLWLNITDGNKHMIGIEAQNTGESKGPRKDPWPDAQMDAYARGVAALLTHLKLPVIACAGHKEYCRPVGRKVDPSFSMDDFRLRRVAKDMAEGLHAKTTRRQPVRSTLCSKFRRAFSVAGHRMPHMAAGNLSPAEVHINYYMAHGFTLEQACGWVGNQQQESGKALVTTANGDQGHAWGVEQWHDDGAKRFQQLKAYAKSIGKAWGDRTAQLAFSVYEVNHLERRSGVLLRKAKTVRAATVAAIGIERPRGFTWTHPEGGYGWANRLANAEALHTQFKIKK